MRAYDRNSLFKGLAGASLFLLAALQGRTAQGDEAAIQGSGQTHTRVTWRVANNGVDSPDCGTRWHPCRTISQGIKNAAAGDLVLVGPGLYGDVNRSCESPESAEEGEEFGFVACAKVPNTSPGGARICLNKAVTVASVEGAEATVIDACGSTFGVVIFGSNSTFGLPQRGFTVTISNEFGGAAIALGASSNVTVSGNIGHPHPRGIGFQIELGENHRIVGNTARGAAKGFITTGLGLQSTRGLRITDNVAASNDVGFELGSDNALVVRRNLAVGNNVGFRILGSGHLLRRNSAIGNRNYGILIEFVDTNGPAIAINQNNIFGNNITARRGNVNCGILNGTDAVVDATKNFWGAPTGPGADPADDACDIAGGQIIHTPFAKKRFRVRQTWKAGNPSEADEEANLSLEGEPAPDSLGSD